MKDSFEKVYERNCSLINEKVTLHREMDNDVMIVKCRYYNLGVCNEDTGSIRACRFRRLDEAIK